MVLPQNYRLAARDISKTLARGQKFQSPHFTLFVVDTKTLVPPQLAILVPVRLDKRAATRNKLKRQLSEILRNQKEKLAPGKQVVLMARKMPSSSQPGKIEEEVGRLLIQKGVFFPDEEKK